MSDTTRLVLPEIAVSQSNKYVTHNQALVFLDALVQAAVEDKDATAPPGSPSEGDCYIPASVATGAWAGYEDYIAYYDGSSWDFHSPLEGWLVFVNDENQFYYCTADGGPWALASLAVLPSITGNALEKLRVNSGATGVEWADEIYGSCHGATIGWTQASATIFTYYDISDSDMSDGQLNGVTHDGSGQLTIGTAGKYLINWYASVSSDTADTYLCIALSVNGTETSEGTSCTYCHTADHVQAVAGTAILDLSASDTLNLSIITGTAGSPDISVSELGFSVLRVGA